MNGIYGRDYLALSGRLHSLIPYPGRRRYAPLPWAVMPWPFRPPNVHHFFKKVNAPALFDNRNWDFLMDMIWYN